MNSTYFITTLLLICFNTFMTIAWYGHLKFTSKPIWAVVLVSWAIAFFEYCFQVPANRYGDLHGINYGALKVIQEVISIATFIVFVRLYFGQTLTWNYWVGFGFIGLGAFFVFYFGSPKVH